LYAQNFRYLPNNNYIVKTYQNLFPLICSFENLLEASRKARKGKRSKTDVGRFEIELEKELLTVREELVSNRYSPGRYREFHVYEPKKRFISAAPYRDRVVHHAVCNIIEPIFERTFIHDSYANRKEKGTHRAILRYQRLCRRNKYLLKCDIKKFFPSIDHDILKQQIRSKFSCPETLWLVNKIIDSSNPQEPVLDYYDGDTLFSPTERRKGLPIGNLTSQFFANVYLNPLDHFVKEQLRCRDYVRYADDFVLFSNNKMELHGWRCEIERYLQSLRLHFHPNKTKVFQSKEGVEFLGHRIFPSHRLLKKANVKAFRKRLRSMQIEYGQGLITIAKVRDRLRSWIAHASFSNTYYFSSVPRKPFKILVSYYSQSDDGKKPLKSI